MSPDVIGGGITCATALLIAAYYAMRPDLLEDK